MNSNNLLNYSGLAELSNLASNDWSIFMKLLEKQQTIFIRNQNRIFDKNYSWPKDPLHTWSRLWEYPYVLFHIRQSFFKINKKQKIKILDFGSGVTFFPFILSNEGYSVVATDIIPEYKKCICLASGL